MLGGRFNRVKELLVCFFVLFSTFLFSQKDEIKKIKVVKEGIKDSVSVRELVSTIPSNCKIISAEFTFAKNGKVIQYVTNGIRGPNELIDGSLKKGTVIHVIVKVLQETDTGKSRVRLMKNKIIIE